MNKRSIKYRIVNKTKLTITLVMIFLTAFTCIIAPVSGKESSAERTYVEYTVTLGDTLWSIAERYNYNNDDVREVIYNIRQANSMNDSIIEHGQTILIPVNQF
ncbi:MAG: LysM peptidoglycan-binding domain-containing protein [Anaerofustis stercorihominis]|nr:LysM peptidoglycan-binding domain-containing protein [Anaerofustis stercorihominis]